MIYRSKRQKQHELKTNNIISGFCQLYVKMLVYLIADQSIFEERVCIKQHDKIYIFTIMHVYFTIIIYDINIHYLPNHSVCTY